MEDYKKLVNRLREEPKDSRKAVLSIYDLCVDAACAIESLLDKLKYAEAERDAVTRHMIELEQEACRLKSRLAAYEDTGLEPEEIYEVRFLIAAQRDPQKLSRLSDLVLADQEGRLVVLPCKVGDRVWVTRAYGKPFDAPREGHVRKFVVHDDELVFLEALIWMDLGEGKNEYGYRTESFGKIVHLTREEAEAALKGGDSPENRAD